MTSSKLYKCNIFSSARNLEVLGVELTTHWERRGYRTHFIKVKSVLL